MQNLELFRWQITKHLKQKLFCVFVFIFKSFFVFFSFVFSFALFQESLVINLYFRWPWLWPDILQTKKRNFISSNRNEIRIIFLKFYSWTCFAGSTPDQTSVFSFPYVLRIPPTTQGVYLKFQIMPKKKLILTKKWNSNSFFIVIFRKIFSFIWSIVETKRPKVLIMTRFTEKVLNPQLTRALPIKGSKSITAAVMAIIGQKFAEKFSNEKTS